MQIQCLLDKRPAFVCLTSYFMYVNVFYRDETGNILLMCICVCLFVCVCSVGGVACIKYSLPEETGVSAWRKIVPTNRAGMRNL